MKTHFTTVKLIGYSLLVFGIISLISLFSHLSSPINKTIGYSKVKIGYPFTYYEEYMLNLDYSDYVWRLDHLFYDVMIAMIIVISIMLISKKILNRQQ